MCSVCRYKQVSLLLVMAFFSPWEGGVSGKGLCFPSSFRDQEVNGYYFSAGARKYSHGLYLAHPFLLEKKPGSLVGISEWSFHNFEISSERVCLCQYL